MVIFAEICGLKATGRSLCSSKASSGVDPFAIQGKTFLGIEIPFRGQFVSKTNDDLEKECLG